MRKIQHIGLQIQYKENTEQLKSFICRTAALAIVPIRFVHLAWQGIKADTPELPRMDEVICYIFQNHVDSWNIPHSRVELV